eukprot:1715274-Amphidinium_carterae.1
MENAGSCSVKSRRSLELPPVHNPQQLETLEKQVKTGAEPCAHARKNQMDHGANGRRLFLAKQKREFPAPFSTAARNTAWIYPSTQLPRCPSRNMANWADKATQQSQAAFKRNRSSRQEVIQLLDHINATCVQGRGTYVGQLDLSKAFPGLSYYRAVQIIAQTRVPDWFVTVVHTGCLQKSFAWKVCGRLSPYRTRVRAVHSPFSNHLGTGSGRA